MHKTFYKPDPIIISSRTLSFRRHPLGSTRHNLLNEPLSATDPFWFAGRYAEESTGIWRGRTKGQLGSFRRDPRSDDGSEESTTSSSDAKWIDKASVNER